MYELKNLLSQVENYLENDQLNPYSNPEDLRAKFPLEIGEGGCDYNQLSEALELYLQNCTNTNSPFFQNQLYQGFNLPAFAGEVITALTNTSMYTYEVSPLATLIEQKLIQKMNQHTGFIDGDGIFVTGGSNANLIALFTARNQAVPEIKSMGTGAHRLVAFVSEESHYSFKNAANLLGLGTQNLVKVPCHSNGVMDLEALNEAIEKVKKEGGQPFFIGATAGTTMKAAYDPIEKLAKVAKREGAWLHVDGSFGGSILLSKTHRTIMNGIELADSLAWNPHKLINIPLVCSVILTKKKGVLAENLMDINTDYLYHDVEDSKCDLGKKSIQCGRRVDALKLWCAWKYYGDSGYEQRIDKLISNASYFESLVKTSPGLELLTERHSFSVCFKIKGTDEANIEWREKLKEQGELLLNYGYVNGHMAWRFVSVNPDIQKEHLDTMVEKIAAGVSSY